MVTGRILEPTPAKAVATPAHPYGSMQQFAALLTGTSEGLLTRESNYVNNYRACNQAVTYLLCCIMSEQSIW